MQTFIEVAVDEAATSTAKGKLLESFARRFLETQNFDSIEAVRLTGMEVDLVASDQVSGEEIYVECKAHKDPISSEVIMKLLGQVVYRGASSGWLITTAELTKDAKGVKLEWEKKAQEERRKLRIYDPAQLITHLVKSKVVFDPERLNLNPKHKNNDSAYLLLTENGNFWAMPVAMPPDAVPGAFCLFDANNGKPITDDHMGGFVSSLKSNISELEWLSQDGAQDEKKISQDDEIQSVVQITSGENWSDYRPARPQDFVGRERLQSDIFSFLKDVATQKGHTRIIALKGPSGLGKSSAIIKLASKSRSRSYRKSFFVYGVDCRAASSRRYPEFAVYSAIRQAMKENFIEKMENFSLGQGSNILSAPDAKEILAELSSAGRTICLFFDQFEELLHREELEEIFDAIRNLCSAVDTAQSNFVLGFSWKTDGAVSPEHPAYNLWHNLSDRRAEFNLATFTRRETKSALSKFANELGEPLVPQISRLLQDHCQGYPWLLKKLCIHILDLKRSGVGQLEVLSKGLSIENLFAKDLESLSSDEIACVKAVAKEAPVELYKIDEAYGSDVVRALVDKRILIRSGHRLSLYWDIFRDYILTNQVPFIPISYIPQVQISAYVQALEVLSAHNSISYGKLADVLDLSPGGVDNLVRDLVMLRHANTNRKAELIERTFESPAEASALLFRFYSSHVVYRKLLAKLGTKIEFRQDEVIRTLKYLYQDREFSENTWRQYSNRIMKSLAVAGLTSQLGGVYMIVEQTAPLPLPSSEELRASRPGEFLAASPPNKAVHAVEMLLEGKVARDHLIRECGRNVYYVLASLGIAHDEAGFVNLANSDFTDPNTIVKRAAIRSRILGFVISLLNADQSLSGRRVGDLVAKRFSYPWSNASKIRTGNALKRWALWILSENESLVE